MNYSSIFLCIYIHIYIHGFIPLAIVKQFQTGPGVGWGAGSPAAVPRKAALKLAAYGEGAVQKGNNAITY